MQCESSSSEQYSQIGVQLLALLDEDDEDDDHGAFLAPGLRGAFFGANLLARLCIVLTGFASSCTVENKMLSIPEHNSVHVFDER